MERKIVFVKKQGTETLTEQEVLDIFNKSEDLAEIKEAVEKAEERMYVTWASVDMKDNAGELIPIEDIIADQKTLLKRHGPITDNQSN